MDDFAAEMFFDAHEDSYEADFGDFLEDTWTDEKDWYMVESGLFGDC